MFKKSSCIKLLEYFFTFLIIISINFALPRMMPGDPFLHSAGDADEVIISYSSEQIQYYREYYGLDLPIYQQYFNYLQDLSRGELGFSYYYKQDVTQIILNRIPWTMFLVLSALLLSIILGIALGSYSVWHRQKWQDKVLYTFLMIFSEIPAFLMGLALLIFFAAGLGWFPLAGAKTHYAVYSSFGEKIMDIISHGILPIITLTLARTGGIYLLVRNSLSTVLTKEYIRTARAKGLKEFRIKYFHGLGNALLPLITRIALQIGGLVGGAILAENVFAYPGLGTLMSSAVAVRDYPLLQGIFLVLAAGVVLANILADLLYKCVDPRIKSQKS